VLNREQKRAAERDIRRRYAKDAVDLAAARAAAPKIFVAYCTSGLVHEMWMMSLLSFIARSPGKYQIRPAGVTTGPLLSRARNTLVESFLESEDDYMLFTDTDMVFAIEDVDALVASDAPIAGGLYFTAAPSGLQAPWCTALVPSEDGSAYVPLVLPEPTPEDESFTTPDPIEVSCVGMGLTLIKREVLEALAPAKKLWPFAETDEERGLGEDLTFCLRAAEKGFRTVVVPQARVGHIKMVVL
jgi:hypothetical protein